VLDQKAKDVEGLRLDGNRLAVLQDDHPTDVDPDVPEFVDRRADHG
jgi:hypothetical protein